MIKKLAIVPFLFFWIITQAQDPHFSQFYANPFYLNPALAGSEINGRIVTNYRNQWPQLHKAYETYNAAYDQYIQKIHGGVGVSFLYDKTGGGLLNTGIISLGYSYHLDITRKLSVKMGIKSSYVQKTINWNEAVWGDQIDPNSGFIYQTNQPRGDNAKYFDFSSGMVIYTEHFFAGYAIDHVTTPDESLYGNGQKLPMRHTVHAGYKFYVGPGGKYDKSVIVSPSFLMSRQATFTNLNIGVYVKKNKLVLGSWYRHKDAIVLLLGLNLENLRIGYSFDYTISGLNASVNGSHEVSVTIILPSSKRKDNTKALSCPSF